MQIIVHGASGFIGGQAAKHLALAGHEVIAPSRSECDLLDAQKTAAFYGSIKKPSAVVMMAVVNKAVDGSFDGCLRNLHIVNNFMTAASGCEITSVVYASSADVFGIAPPCPITENTKPNPANLYGIAKLACEQIMLLPQRLVCPVTVLRFPGVYGRGDQGKSLIGLFIKRILNGEQLNLCGGGKVLRDYAEVGDVCSIIEQLISRPLGGLLNVATGKSMAICDILQVIEEALSKRAIIKQAPSDANAAADLIFDTVKLNEYMGSAFRMLSMKDGVRKYIEALNEERSPG